MLRALIFDFDGTILDTEMPWYRAWQEVYGAHGAELALTEWAKAVGAADEAFDPVAHLEGLLGRPVAREAAEAATRERALVLIGQERLRAGFVDLLEAAHARGLRVGLASSSSAKWVHGHLERLGIRARFDAICTADDVAAAKPAPDLYLLALERLGVGAGEAVAIEDSPNGLLAARAAGLACVVVPNDLTRSFAFADPHVWMESLEEVTLALLEEVCRENTNAP